MNEHAFKLFFAQAFIKVLQEKFTVYILIMINIIKELIIEQQVKALNNAMSCTLNALKIQTLLIELNEYENLFLTKSVDQLSLHEDHDHAIEIRIESLYELLYNLSNTKLVILRQYLNDVLMKE